MTVSHANGQWVFDAAMPLRGKAGAVAEADGVKVIQSYSGRAVKVTHKGAYSSLNQSYAKLHAFTKTQKLREKDLTWEEYVGEPGETADEALLTNVYIAIE